MARKKEPAECSMCLELGEFVVKLLLEIKAQDRKLLHMAKVLNEVVEEYVIDKGRGRTESDRDAELCDLHQINKLSYQDISDKTGLNVAAVTKLVQREAKRRKLREDGKRMEEEAKQWIAVAKKQRAKLMAPLRAK